MSTVAGKDLDPQVGTHWLARADAETRLQLMIGLLSRFNHDLRTPLNTIQGWTHLLQQGAVDSTRSKHVADVIARNSREQTVLLEDFIDDGRVVLGAARPENEALRIEEVLNAALERVAPVLTLHAVSLQPDIKVGPAEISADARRLQRLFYRLLVVVARRAREASAVELSASATATMFKMSIRATPNDSDWTDAALLDLRISSFFAALYKGNLEVAQPQHASLQLTLPTTG